MKTRIEITREIQEGLGPVATRSDAERLFQHLYDLDLITWGQYSGYELPEDLDVVEAFVQMEREEAAQ